MWKISYLTTIKGTGLFLSRSNIIYRCTCPGCNHWYIGKFECHLNVRTQKHARVDKNSAEFQHITNTKRNHIHDFYELTAIVLTIKKKTSRWLMQIRRS